MPQVKTIQFPNTARGQRKKNEALAQYLAAGWKVISETITPGRYNTENACCMFLACGPVGAFMGGHTDGVINVTLQHEGTPPALTRRTSKTTESSKSLIQVALALGTLFSLLLVLVGITGVFSNLRAGVETILLGILAFPFLGKVIQKYFRFRLHPAVQVIAGIGLLVLFAETVPSRNGNQVNASASPRQNAQKSPPATVKSEIEEEEEAIDAVQNAKLSVPGQGPSYTTVVDGLQYFAKSPEVKFLGWSAKAKANGATLSV